MSSTGGLHPSLFPSLLCGWLLVVAPTEAGQAAPARVVEVGLGYGHGCARLDDGRVRCWGSNTWGQLGQQDLPRSLTPIEVAGLPPAERLVVGGNHNCILSQKRQVLCWGYNHRGQLGTPSSIATSSAQPLLVTPLTGVVDLALGGSHSCAVLEDGSVRCWGDNLFGQLGDGTRKGRPAPAPVPQLPSSSHVALGDQHTCAITRQGEAWCWGGNAYGQLGDGSQMERTQARKVAELAGVSQLALGYSHSCALLREGRVRCWGVNLDGQLGDGSRVSRLTPVPLPLERVAEVAAGSNHSCARLTSGGIACWGSQGHGRLGDGVISGLGRRLEPFVLPLRDVVRISANGDHTCAITGNGLLSCWGKNVQGMLGIGSEEAASTPTPVR